MPGIADKFGKASISTDTAAVATTVKTTRVAGVNVLEAFDLSKYAQDTPVFVITYKKTTDPVTGIVTITNFRSWKALVNPGANTLTNLTIQPGYADDIGNAVGDFIECIPTAAWANSLIDGILTSLNPDGTLKTSAVQTALGLGGGSLNGWNVLGFTPNTIVDNGNRNYTATILGVDKTDTLSPATRILGVRSSAAPTYMGGLFNGSSHYYTKASPTGTLGTITNNFTIMGWANPVGYGVAQATIAARMDAAGANGMFLRQETDGTICVGVCNGGGGNYRLFYTQLSVPLNKKSHVAATWASGVVTMFIDGVQQNLKTVVTAGTAPTVAGTGGDFSIGRYGAYNGMYYNGYISGVGVFDAVLSGATIRSLKNQVLTGGEANCIGAWSLNNVATDQSAAANNLTAQNGVTFTSGFAPYATNAFDVATGSNEFGIVQTSVFTGGNTVLTIQCPEGCALPTVGGLSSLQYSSAKAPYGFPASVDRHAVEAWAWSTAAFASPSGVINTNRAMYLPAGDWNFALTSGMALTRAAAGVGGIRFWVSNNASGEQYPQVSVFHYINAVAYWETRLQNRGSIRLTAAQTLTAMIQPEDNGVYNSISFANNWVNGRGPFLMRAENAYL